MTKTKRVLSVLVIMSMLLASCTAEYKEHMQANKEIAWVQTTNQRLAVGELVKIINAVVKPFEEEYVAQTLGVPSENVTVATDENGLPYIAATKVKENPTTDMQYALFTMKGMFDALMEYQHRETMARIKLDLARIRVEAIRYLQPIIEKIYDQHLVDNNKPPSTNDVLIALVKQIPFVATVGGMYGLGVAGIEAAGNKISGTFTNSSVATDKAASASGFGRANTGDNASASGTTEGAIRENIGNEQGESGSVSTSGDNTIGNVEAAATE